MSDVCADFLLTDLYLLLADKQQRAKMQQKG